jgi:uncharacterized protein YoxC
MAASLVPETPLGKIIYLAVLIAIIVVFYQQIMGLLKVKCGLREPALMIEQFDSLQYKSSVKYFNGLLKRLDALDKDIETSRANVDSMNKMFEDFQSDICYILNQVDEGIQGNYVANVPEDNYKLPAEEQEKRKKERQAKSVTYIKNLKAAFSKSNDNTPILECFVDTETADLQNLRSDLDNRINEVKANLDGLKGSLNNLDSGLSEKQIAIYYLTLKYNDKYLRQMLENMSKKKEGFEDVSPKDPVDAISSMESELKTLNETVLTYKGLIAKMAQIIIDQRAILKKTKAIGTDEEYQKTTLNSSYSQVSTKAPA